MKRSWLSELCLTLRVEAAAVGLWLCRNGLHKSPPRKVWSLSRSGWVYVCSRCGCGKGR